MANISGDADAYAWLRLSIGSAILCLYFANVAISGARSAPHSLLYS